MRTRVILSVLLLFAAFIILSGISGGKYNVSKPQVADGNPFPPLPPNPPNPSAMSNLLMADGNPFPPLPPNPPNPSAVSTTSV